jgi:ferric-dicitrate binding protein FerR (iron transport regulator)
MSSKNQHTNPKESDTKLAADYNEYLEGNLSKDSIQDLLFLKLDSVKQTDKLLQQHIQIRGQEDVWSQILSQTENGNSSARKPIPIRFASRSSWYRLAIAAMLVLSLTTLLWYQFASFGNQLIADRSSEVQTVALSDGSTVTLRPNSELSYLVNQANAITVSLKGEAVFDVVSDPTRIFSVQTENSRVVVTGTRFNVRSDQNQSSVYLLEGAVTFENIDATNSVVLNPGQASKVDQNGSPVAPFEFDEQSILGWTQSRITLTNRSLRSVVQELESHFDITIQVPDSLSNEILGGSISLESLDQTLQDLGLVLGGEFNSSRIGVYQFEPDP